MKGNYNGLHAMLAPEEARWLLQNAEILGITSGDAHYTAEKLESIAKKVNAQRRRTYSEKEYIPVPGEVIQSFFRHVGRQKLTVEDFRPRRT